MNVIENNPPRVRLSWNEAFGCISQAWSKVHNVKLAFFAAYLIYVPFQLLDRVLEAYLISIFFGGISLLLAAGMLYMAIKRVDGLDVNYKQVFYPFDRSLWYKLFLFEMIRWSIIVVVAMVLFIIPACVRVLPPFSDPGLSDITKLLTALIYVISFVVVLYLYCRFKLGVGFVLDERVGPFNAIKKAWRASSGNAGKIFILSCAQVLAVLLGIISLGIGLIWMLPLNHPISAQMYRKLQTAG